MGPASTDPRKTRFQFRAPSRPWLLTLSLIVLGEGLCVLVAPSLDVSRGVASVLSFTCVCGSVLAASSVAPSGSLWRLAWVFVPVFAIAAVAMTDARASNPGAVMLITVSLLAIGTLAGGLIGGRIQHPGHLLVVAYVSSLADIFSVLHRDGVSARIVAAEAILVLAAMGWPLFGTSELPPMLGVGDIVLTALYVTTARAHKLGVKQMVLALSVGYSATLVSLFVFARAIPALPFLGAAVIALVPPAHRLRREDLPAAILGMTTLTALFAWLWFR